MLSSRGDSLEIVERLRRGRTAGRTWLIETVRGHKTPQATYRKPLLDACAGIELPEPITSHRLRHTYAITMLNAGMSLVSVMKLLGHRDQRMTLRYVEVTLETVGREYFEALTHLERNYTQPRGQPGDLENFDPEVAIDHVKSWLQQEQAGNRKQKRRKQLLLRRLRKMRPRSCV